MRISLCTGGAVVQGGRYLGWEKKNDRCRFGFSQGHRERQGARGQEGGIMKLTLRRHQSTARLRLLREFDAIH
jgi:hypothetical protein